MADIFQEIDEELRKDKAKEWWGKYGNYAIAGMAVLLAIAAGVPAWKAYDESQRSQSSDAFAAAVSLADGGDSAAALAALSEIADPSSGGYGVLAAMKEAQLRAAAGESAAAVALWDSVAESSAASDVLRQVATLHSVMQQIDTGDAAALDARLAPMTAAGEPFRASALELQAVLALRGGDEARARDLYTLIADDLEAPAGLRQRAAQMLAALRDDS